MEEVAKKEEEEKELKKKRLDFSYVLMQKKVDYTNSVYDALQGKINYLYGFTAASIAFYLTLIVQNKLFYCTIPWLLDLRIAGIIGLGGVLLCLTIATMVREFKHAPKLDSIYPKAKEEFPYSYYMMKHKVIAAMKEEVQLNMPALDHIAFWVNLSIWLLFGSIFVIILACLLH